MKVYNLISEKAHERAVLLLTDDKYCLIDLLQYAKSEMEEYDGVYLKKGGSVDLGGIIDEISRVTRMLNDDPFPDLVEPEGMEVVLESIMIENFSLKERIKALEKEREEVKVEKYYEIRSEIDKLSRSKPYKPLGEPKYCKAKRPTKQSYWKGL